MASWTPRAVGDKALACLLRALPGTRVNGTDPEAERSPTQAALRLARDERGPVSRELWEAQAFALTLNLQEGGVFTWSD